MIGPRNETEVLFLSITENCEMLFERAHWKEGVTLEFKMTKPREIFHFNPSIQIKGD